MERRSVAPGEVVTVTRPMNDHGTVTVVVDETNETRHLVDYTTREIEDALRSLPAGTSVPLQMRPVGTRANV